MRIQAFLTPGLLRELLDYNPDEGVFRWKVARPPRKIGEVAGTLTTAGYRHIRIRKQSVYAHRLAWFWVHGVWPERHIDHRNGNPDDNQIANLREADDMRNMQNVVKAKRDSKSGIRGVHQHANGRWVAQIKADGVYRYLGIYPTSEAAAEAYRRAKAGLHYFWDQEALPA